MLPTLKKKKQKNNAAACCQGPVKVELLKGAGLLTHDLRYIGSLRAGSPGELARRLLYRCSALPTQLSRQLGAGHIVSS